MTCCDKQKQSDGQQSDGQGKKMVAAPWWRSGHNLMMLGCVAIMGYAIFGTGSENSSWFSYLVLLACPLMHLLMMRSGQGCNDGKRSPRDPEENAQVMPSETPFDAAQPIPIDTRKPPRIQREF